MNDCITGSQFEIIAKAKQALLDSTNIETSPEEMRVLDNFLFRCWQMGWLDKYEKDLVEVVRCKDCKHKHGYRCDHFSSNHVCVLDDDYCSYGERKDDEK